MRFLTQAAVALLLVGGSMVAIQISNDSRPAQKVTTPYISTKTGHGSGISLGDGLFLTARHVADDSKERIRVVLESKRYLATVEKVWEDRDLVLLRSEVKLPAVPLRCDAVPVGEPVYAMGYPWDNGLVTMRGFTAQPVKWNQKVDMNEGEGEFVAKYRALQVLDLRAAPGMSGGPVYDSRNRVIGMTVMVEDQFVTLTLPGPALCEALNINTPTPRAASPVVTDDAPIVITVPKSSAPKKPRGKE